MSPDHPTAGDKELEKALYDYCAQLWERQAQRKESLEKKAQIYLSLVTLILGAIFFKFELLRSVGQVIAGGSTPVATASIWAATAALGAGLAWTLLAVLAAVRLQSYKTEHPGRLVTSLFAPDSGYLEARTPGGFYHAAALSYALALEINKKNNDRKAAWVRRASYGALLSVTALAALLAVAAVFHLEGGAPS